MSRRHPSSYRPQSSFAGVEDWRATAEHWHRVATARGAVTAQPPRQHVPVDPIAAAKRSGRAAAAAEAAEIAAMCAKLGQAHRALEFLAAGMSATDVCKILLGGAAPEASPVLRSERPAPSAEAVDRWVAALEAARSRTSIREAW